MKVVFVALVLGVCVLAYGIGVAWADDGTSAAAPRDDCPEKDGGGSSGSSGSSGAEQQF